MKASELAKKYDCTHQRISVLRKKLCNPEDFCEETKEILRSGVEKIEKHFSAEDDDALEPKYVRVQVLHPAPSGLFFYCKKLDRPTRKVCVAVPNTHTSSMRMGLIFKAQVIQKNGEEFYRHEVIQKREEQRQKRFQKIRK